MYFKMNDVVRLLDDLPTDGLLKGALGVVVAEFSDPVEAYEVEFCNEDGDTIVQTALLPVQIELVR